MFEALRLFRGYKTKKEEKTNKKKNKNNMWLLKTKTKSIENRRKTIGYYCVSYIYG